MGVLKVSHGRRSTLSFVIAATLLLAIPFHVRPANFIVDDGFFYPQIARFIAHGQGSTFNGWMPTDGYHPLWMIVCVLAAKITSQSTALLQILGGVGDLLILFSLIVLVKFAEVDRKRGVFAGVILLLFMSMVLANWRLLETDLALALQIATLAVVVPIFPTVQARLGRWRNVALGTLLGLVMLSRLDLVFFAATVLSYQLFSRRESVSASSRIRSTFVQGLIATILVLPYFVWNYRSFHHLEPVSGAIKSTFPHINRHPGLSAIVFLIPVGFLLVAPLLFRKNRTLYDEIALLAGAAAVLHYIYTVSFGFMCTWYPTSGFICLAMGLIFWTDIVLRRFSIPYWLEIAAATCLVAVLIVAAALRTASNLTFTRLLAGRVSIHDKYLQPDRALAIKLDETLPANSRIFVYDGPGGVAFYSKMSILPVDGLVADYAYNDEVVRDGFARYAAEHDIDYVVAPYLKPGQIYDELGLREMRVAGGQTMDVEAPLTHKAAGRVMLQDVDLLFRIGTTSPGFEATLPELGVWRLEHNMVPKR